MTGQHDADEDHSRDLVRQDTLHSDMKVIARTRYGAPKDGEDEVFRALIWWGSVLVKGHTGFLWTLGAALLIAIGALIALFASGSWHQFVAGIPQ